MLGKLVMAVLTIVVALVLLRHFNARTMHQPRVKPADKPRPIQPEAAADNEPVTLKKDPETGVYKASGD